MKFFIMSQAASKGNTALLVIGIISLLIFTKIISSSQNDISAINTVPTQAFLYLIFIYIISEKTYQFSSDSIFDFYKKYFVFGIFCLPTAIAFWTKDYPQLLSLGLSFIIALIFSWLAQRRRMPVKLFSNFYESIIQNILVFISTIWNMLWVIILLEKMRILPYSLNESLRFLPIDKIIDIRFAIAILLSIGIMLLSIINLIEKNEWSNIRFQKKAKLPKLKEGSLSIFSLLTVISRVFVIILINVLGVTILINGLLIPLALVIDFVVRLICEICIVFIKILNEYLTILLYLFFYLVLFFIQLLIFKVSPMLIAYVHGDMVVLKEVTIYFALLFCLAAIFKSLIAYLFADTKNYQYIFVSIITCFESTVILLAISWLIGMLFFIFGLFSVFHIVGFERLTPFSIIFLILIIMGGVFYLYKVLRKSNLEDEEIENIITFKDINWKSISKSIATFIILLILLLFTSQAELQIIARSFPNSIKNRDNKDKNSLKTNRSIDTSESFINQKGHIIRNNEQPKIDYSDVYWFLPKVRNQAIKKSLNDSTIVTSGLLNSSNHSVDLSMDSHFTNPSLYKNSYLPKRQSGTTYVIKSMKIRGYEDGHVDTQISIEPVSYPQRN